jgi:HAMP domain-containing protein
LHDVSLALLLTLPVLLGVVAGTAWVMTGRTLRPVESIRQQVAEISTRELSRRVPVPATSDESNASHER